METATADPKKVTITGPESVLGQIATVEAIVDVSGVGEDMATNSKVVLLDEAGNEISQDRLTLNRTSVAVDVKITMGKSVPLKFTTNETRQTDIGMKKQNAAFPALSWWAAVKHLPVSVNWKSPGHR